MPEATLPDLLFTPLRFRNLTLKNRILRSNMSGRFDNYDGTGTQARINWERRFAEGGVAAIVSAHVPVRRDGWIAPGFAMLDHDDKIPFWRRLIDEVHRHGCKYIMQLSHSGRQRDLPGIVNAGDLALSSTSRVEPINGLRCRAMTAGEIQEMVADFRAAAGRARLAGADGIETHSANGYLLTQFLSPAINDRNDDYGGSPENRARILLEILRAMRAEVGDDFHIQVKINGRDYGDTLQPWLNAGTSLSESAQLAKWCEEAGADAVVVSGGSFAPHPKNPAGDMPIDTARRTYGTMMSSGKHTLRNYFLLGLPVIAALYRWWWRRRRGPVESIEGVFAADAAHIKRAVRIPVLVTGGFQTASYIRRVISDGMCDGVTIARPLIANPDLVRLFAAGHDRAPRPCTYCNRCLYEAIESPLACYDADRFDGDRERMMAAALSVFRPQTFEELEDGASGRAGPQVRVIGG